MRVGGASSAAREAGSAWADDGSSASGGTVDSPRRALAIVVAAFGQLWLVKNVFRPERPDRPTGGLVHPAAERAIDALDAAGVDPADVDSLYYGNFMGELAEHQGHQGPLMAEAAAKRIAWAVEQELKAGLVDDAFPTVAAMEKAFPRKDGGAA